MRTNTLHTLSVSRAMRRQIVCLQQDKTIGHGINIIIKHKVNALLVVNERQDPVGVVSKTDIMGAYPQAPFLLHPPHQAPAADVYASVQDLQSTCDRPLPPWNALIDIPCL